MIALLCSVDIEAKLLLERLGSPSRSIIGSKPVYDGELFGRAVRLCIGGMGKVNASHAATLMVLQEPPEALIIFGIGGAYPGSGAAVGDVAVAEREIAGDEGVLTCDGFRDTGYIGIPLLKTAAFTIFNTYAASETLLARAGQALSDLPGERVRTGSFVTLSTCTGTSERARELEQRYAGLCENMEGAAAAHVAMGHGIPWIEVRGISNIVEDRNTAAWDIPRAAAGAQQAVLKILEAWRP
jgi:futalosine hydrolase